MASKKREMPSHMIRAVERMERLSAAVDLVLDVRDARAPAVSRCRLIPKLFPGAPIVPVLAKSDLAERAAVDRWLAELRSGDNAALAFHPGRKGGAARFWADIRRAAPLRPGVVKTLVAGIPNVGKSTIVNFLAGGRRARVGARPGITRDIQLLRGPDNFFLYDTPGVLPPTASGPREFAILALIGALQENAFDFQEAALFFLETALPDRGAALAEFYRMDECPSDPAEFFERLARRRGFLRTGGEPDLDRAWRRVVEDVSLGKIHGISLELP